MTTLSLERAVDARMRGPRPQFVVRPTHAKRVTRLLESIGLRVTGVAYYAGPGGSAILDVDDPIAIEEDSRAWRALTAAGYDVKPDF